MPYGTCNGNYKCDSCKCSLSKGSLAWVKIKPIKSKLFCMKCKPEESLRDLKPSPDPIQKRLRVLEVVNKILKKKNDALKEELARLKGRKVQKKGKQLFRCSV